jgi:hypothetical protein
MFQERSGAFIVTTDFQNITPLAPAVDGLVDQPKPLLTNLLDFKILNRGHP